VHSPLKFRRRYVGVVLIGLVGCIGLMSGWRWYAPPALATWSVGRVVEVIAFSPDGRLLAVAELTPPAYQSSTLQVRRVPDGAVVLAMHSAINDINSMTFSPDGRLLVIGGDDTIEAWDIATGMQGYSVSAQAGADTPGRVRYLGFSTDGTMLQSITSGGSLRAWRASDGQSVETLVAGQEDARVQSFTDRADGLYIALHTDNDIVVRHPDGSLVTLFEHRTYDDFQASEASGHLFNAAGDLVSGLRRDTIRLWRVGDGSIHATLEGHTDTVHSIAFSPDGQFLASGSGQPFVFATEHYGDKTLRLWRVSDGTLVKTFRAHRDRIVSLAWSPDGTLLASASRDGTVKLWRVP
jgi:WD40 repeat protein